MLYNVVLFLHIVGAVTMFMAIAILALSMLSMLHSKDTENVKRWSGLAVRTDGLFPMSSLLILVPGLYLSISTWGWGAAWINVSLAALLGASFLGPVINLRRLKGILAAAEAETDVVPSAALMNKVRDRVLWNSVFVMAMLAVGILFLMAVKLALPGSLITMAIAVVAGFSLAHFLLGKHRPEASADTVSFR
ncbi:DUF2269 family protein [Planomicrobium sp. MB-3u-38]|uniref:DUF2269 family protein n=1 Tax=Planomicrobium sp. MB-3u-38 TaxID=2058318 RepID=UPI000C798E6F|nr:DUF2269 family protein [Planomicrobium sp. MB-3u-38]PKH08543.1 hypothetical protein CXF70_16690 [Planomicrobium sp. MB-3u-38]